MKIIFLDRDGVINEDPGVGAYVTRWEDFRFIEGAVEAIRTLTEARYKIYVISNQRGVGRGLFTQAALDRITERMLAKIEKSGGKVAGVFYCTHREDNCDCRKPKAGLFKQAVGELRGAFKDTYFIGDDKRDIEAGRNLGCKTVLVFSGKTKRPQLDTWDFLPDRMCDDLLQAVRKAVLKKA